jgi:hypothetical protein
MGQAFIFFRALGRFLSLRTGIAVRDTLQQALETGGIRVA